jgi:hypothetical protein
MRRLGSVVGLVVLAGAIPAWSQQVNQPPPKESIVAFQDISVIPMDTERVLPHQMVLVRNGKIVDVGSVSSVHLPPKTMLIDGRGRFLMPGLADMHTHVDRKEMLPLFLAAGVTTVLNMGLASPEFVTTTRDEIRRGSVLGPRVFAAFLIDGPGDPGPEYVPVCERDARAAVERAKLEGYDFIKAYERLQPEIFAAVLDEARKQHIAVVGHIATAVGLESSLAQGQVMIAHAEEYYKTYFEHKPNDARIPAAVELTLRAGAYVTPNLSFFANLTKMTSDLEFFDERMAEPDIAFLPPDIRGDWLADRPSKASDRFVPELAMLKKLTLALSKAGVPLLTGTDSPGGLIPGTSLDDDVEQQCGTHSVPGALGRYPRSGTVHPPIRARGGGVWNHYDWGVSRSRLAYRESADRRSRFATTCGSDGPRALVRTQRTTGDGGRTNSRLRASRGDGNGVPRRSD